MSITPNDLLSQAKTLADSAATEVELRTAISRAYYAAFHEAKRFHDGLASRGKTPMTPTGVHGTLSYRLGHPSIPASLKYRRSQDIGRHLAWLHDKRVKADYRLGRNVVVGERDEVLQRVLRIFALAV